MPVGISYTEIAERRKRARERGELVAQFEMGACFTAPEGWYARKERSKDECFGLYDTTRGEQDVKRQTKLLRNISGRTLLLLEDPDDHKMNTEMFSKQHISVTYFRAAILDEDGSDWDSDTGMVLEFETESPSWKAMSTYPDKVTPRHKAPYELF